MDARDEAVVAGQLGRSPRDVTGVPVRCHLGFPVVIETAPVLLEGSPNPTLLYLTCPALAAAISGIEAGGGVRAFRARCRDDRHFRGIVEAVSALYRRRREQLAGPRGEEARLDAGIGGPDNPEVASCLHAHAAAFLAVMSGWLEAEAELLSDVERLWADLYPGVSFPWCGDGRCNRWVESCRRAVIDVGTISVRLLVADIADGRVHDVARWAEVTRLGEGLEAGGRLLPAAAARTAQVVRRFAEEARERGAQSILIVGTSAARDAADGEVFIRALGAENAVEAQVLTGEQEAALAYAGVILDVSGEPVVVDIGGGSTELIRRCDDGRLDTVSLNLGASRATGAWLKSGPATADGLAQVREEAMAAVAGLRLRFGAESGGGAPGTRELGRRAPGGAESGRGASGGPAPILAGVAGTVTTLACLDASLQQYDREAIHLREMTAESVRRLTSRLAAMSCEQRGALPCVQPGRAGVIVAGATILLVLMESLGYDRLTVSERDLLDGLILRGAC